MVVKCYLVKHSVTSLGHQPYSPDLSHPPPSPVLLALSTTTKLSGRKTIRECQGIHCKMDENTDRGIQKWYPGTHPHVFQILPKARLCQREPL
jgi:hypothetical protein